MRAQIPKVLNTENIKNNKTKCRTKINESNTQTLKLDTFDLSYYIIISNYIL